MFFVTMADIVTLYVSNWYWNLTGLVPKWVDSWSLGNVNALEILFLYALSFLPILIKLNKRAFHRAGNYAKFAIKNNITVYYKHIFKYYKYVMLIFLLTIIFDYSAPLIRKV
jgi:hypothetical protein